MYGCVCIYSPTRYCSKCTLGTVVHQSYSTGHPPGAGVLAMREGTTVVDAKYDMLYEELLLSPLTGTKEKLIKTYSL